MAASRASPLPLALALLLAAARAASAQRACAGEYSLCPGASATCALVFESCAQCTGGSSGQYACPMSSACVASADLLPTCPGLAGTHFDASLSIEARLDYLMAQSWTVDEMITQLTDNATEIPRLGIPAYVWLNDDQHGVKQPYATAFPNGASFGAGWDAASMVNVGLALGVEARGVHNSLLDKSAEHGGEGWPGTLKNGAGLTAYAPNVNLVHDPRWGRANEVMSEDPLLTGALVAAYVRGMQNNSGADLVASGAPLLMAACCKHYAVYNVEDLPTDRTLFNADVSARDLWETYLPVFEQCIGPGAAQSVMCSYNAINGVPTCASDGLLNEALRTHMGFDGFVVSDYDAWNNVMATHHYVPTTSLAASVAMNAGIDQEGGGGPTYPPVQQGIPLAVAAGNLTLSRVALSVRRLMRVRIRLGMFDFPSNNRYNAITNASVASPEHLAVAELAARKGMTLLRNGVPAGASAPALPLSLAALKGKRVAVLGPNANASYILLGSYSDPGCCTTGGIPTFLAEFSARAAAAGVAAVDYASGCGDANCDAGNDFAGAAALAATADAVVVVLGMQTAQYDCGGASDRGGCESEAYDRRTCALPGQQPALVAAVRAATRAGVPLVVLFVHGSTFCLDPSFVSATDAILDAWYPGMRGAAAMADAVVGAFSPSGRTPVTWYASDSALPTNRGEMSPYATASSPGLTYRFYDPSVISAAPPVFSFGEGYSYTTFAASQPQFPATVAACAPLPLAVLVTNTGSVDSDVVVAAFLAQANLTVPAPAQRLVAFARQFIPAGQSALVTLPDVAPAARAVVHDDGSGDIFSLPGKRWNEAGTLALRISLGEHNGHAEGGLTFSVAQANTQDLSTC
jgi:beta-glucosidase-like glycosyl hydrolase